MLKQHKKTLVITSVITLLPILIGLLLWNQLPDTFATHWGSDGQPNGWMRKPAAIFVMPLFIFTVHWLSIVVTAHDPKNKDKNHKMIKFSFWICPILSVIMCAVVYGTALGAQFDMIKFPYLLISLMFITIGNYLPKCSHNYTIGIKLPWTIASEENWNATHRFTGKIWLVGGILLMTMHFIPVLQNIYLLIVILLIIVLIPTLYSFRYYLKHK